MKLLTLLSINGSPDKSEELRSPQRHSGHGDLYVITNSELMSEDIENTEPAIHLIASKILVGTVAS